MALNVGTINPSLNLMATNGSVSATLVLPPPDKNGGISFKYKNLGVPMTLPDGVTILTYRDYTKKFVPVLTLKWSIYDDTGAYYKNPNGYGVGNGQTPTFDQLVSVLGTFNPFYLQVKPGFGTGFFNCYVSKDITLTPLAGMVYRDVVIELTGTTGVPTMNV